MPPLPETFQQRYARRWRHLQDKHVRSLAWLLDAPDMLDAQSPAWAGRVASLGAGAADAAADWLAELDADPAALHNYLALGPFARLGRYAEKLLAYYFLHRGTLVAQGVQVREAGTTVGEFDFLLHEGSELVHWEFAVKLYLLEDSGAGQATDYFVGPNLADTLGAKMDKIFTRQLALSQHPAAQPLLPQPVARAQALVKGWLFYHRSEHIASVRPGLAPDHCRGFWCTLAELADQPQSQLLPLNRLDWLAPARADAGLSHADLRAKLAAQFTQDSMPVLVARLENQGYGWEEASRGFIVPDDWQERAGARSRPPLF